MANLRAKGLERSDEVRIDRVRQDTRSGFSKITASWKTTSGVAGCMVITVIASFFMIMMPLSTELMLAWMSLFYFVWVRQGNRKYDFPYRAPIHSGVNDGSYSNRKKGEGLAFFGREISSKVEIWAAKPDIGTHLLVIGTTGSGKTEALLGIAFNSLVYLSGFAYIDGKGDPKLVENVFRLTAIVNRHIDLLQLSFLTGGRNFAERQPDKVTNTCAPYSSGSDAVISELQISQLDGGGSGGDMWRGRAIAFLQAMNRPLVYQRDCGHILLDPNAYLPYFDLPTLENYAIEYIDFNEIDYKKDEQFKKLIAPLTNFVTTLPGYSIANKGNQEQKTNEQFGYITMQLTRLFNDMSYTYAHIYSTGLGEIYMYDVVLNRRILVGAIPALERSMDTLQMLGKIIVGQIKQMMAGALGNRVEGITRVILDARPTNAKFPFQVLLDEYGYYIVVGFACGLAQGRSLGFSICVATQDMSSLKKSSPEEADATFENTNIRMVGRITSGRKSDTWEKISGLVGTAYVEVISGKEHSVGEFSDRYRTNRDTRFERMDRLEYDDLAGQENGEFTFLIGKKSSDGSQGVAVIRARTFYTETKKPREIRLNHFVAVAPPTLNEIRVAKGRMAFQDAMSKVIEEGLFAKVFPDDMNRPQCLTGAANKIPPLRFAIDAINASQNVSATSHANIARALVLQAHQKVKSNNAIVDSAVAKAKQQQQRTEGSQNAPQTVVKNTPPESIAGHVKAESPPSVANEVNQPKSSPLEIEKTLGIATATNSSKKKPVSNITPIQNLTGLAGQRVAAFLIQEESSGKEGYSIDVQVMDRDIEFDDDADVNVNLGTLTSVSARVPSQPEVNAAMKLMLTASGYGADINNQFVITSAVDRINATLDKATVYYQGAIPEPLPNDVFRDAIEMLRQKIEINQHGNVNNDDR